MVLNDMSTEVIASESAATVHRSVSEPPPVGQDATVPSAVATLPDRIRQAIAAAHVAVEATPLAQAMSRGTVSVSEYVALLQELHHWHRSLESCLSAASDCELVRLVYRPETMNRTAILVSDLSAFRVQPSERPGPVVEQMIAELTTWQARKPWALLGALYVMEGSRMGSMLLVRSLSQAFSLSNAAAVGLDYHRQDMANRPQAWKQFRQELAELSLSPVQQDDVIQAAVVTMQGLVQLYASLLVSAANNPTVTANSD